ncbi:alpha/beta hydrolase [Tenggerimyces flavus]|uniref:Alpha/beta hydrolase n=1 Tax=Tenggerimyces flavus TaxID=1708749 RepID=A0ABV7YKP2_9ACTN|nr:alpha/beta hydrolase [Tenggerimyces flavus]MBM7784075.1 acetyl esterase [Tenggerimyces flavus]
MSVRSDPRFAVETEAFLELLGPRDEPVSLDDLVASRTAPRNPALFGTAPPIAIREDLVLDLPGRDVRARLYRDDAETPAPLLLWLHGGGFVAGALDDVDVVCTGLAKQARVNVVSLDYRLAPEHPFPAGLDDTYDAIAWLHTHKARLGGDGEVLAGGQSAGANLVAAACLRARDEGGPRVARQLLCYPSVGMHRDTASQRLFDGVVLNSKHSHWFDELYLAGQEVTPYVAPLQAPSHADLPRALVIGAGRDPLRDDARDYAKALENAGVETEYVEYADTPHAFLQFAGMLPTAVRAAIGDLSVYLP